LQLTPKENTPEQNQSVSLPRRLGAEAVGTALLLATVVGSGIMAEQLSGGNTAIALLANTLATGAALVALILTFGSISGAHFNPAVTLADAFEGGIAWRETPYYVLAQVAGAFIGTMAAHLMFGLSLVSLSQHVRSGPSQLFSEFVATFGLLSVIWGCSRLRSNTVAFAVGAYITAAYWFTASTSFANPAVTLARSFTDTFSGIRPSDAPGFMIAQLAGALAATFLFRWLVPSLKKTLRNSSCRMAKPGRIPRMDAVLFACVHNAGRSQMAAGWFNKICDRTKASGISAGTEPGERVHPEVVRVMKEAGIDLASMSPQFLSTELAQKAMLLVTMGCGDACPYVPGLRKLDWPLRDPKGQPIEIVRQIRDEVRARVTALAEERGWL
jgi:glycerol uptake facilitator-like aquaporin/protein-tyrosine-phosphatase